MYTTETGVHRLSPPLIRCPLRYVDSGSVELFSHLMTWMIEYFAALPLKSTFAYRVVTSAVLHHHDE